MLNRVMTLLCALMLLSAPAYAAPETGKPAPDFAATDIEGKAVQLSALKGKIVVLEWNNPGCPFVKKHYGSGNMQELQAYAGKQGVVWISVDSSAPGRQGNMTAEEAKAYISAHKASPTHYILDPEGKIGLLYDAKNTPGMYVIDAKGNLAYKGAIDDKPTADPADIATAHNYVKAALDALLAGKPVDPAQTQAYGCSVKYAD